MLTWCHSSPHHPAACKLQQSCDSLTAVLSTHPGRANNGLVTTESVAHVPGDGEMAEAEAPAIPKQELLYCERFVELLTDMLSQVRRFQLPQCGAT